jgi:sortase A
MIDRIHRLVSPTMFERSQTFRILQWILIVAGLTLVGFWVGARLSGWFGGKTEIQRFEEARAKAATETVVEATPVPIARDLPIDLPVDTSLWAEDRIDEYELSLEHDFDAPLAVLRIPKINLEVAVLSGTTELALNRGVGHIDGTPAPGEEGNTGIAGHRDGYFRGLKDVEVGDLIEMETLTDSEIYTITELFLVDPPDVWVLEPTENPSITLVTCYPFYYAGSAPQRYIVRAERQQP